MENMPTPESKPNRGVTSKPQRLAQGAIVGALTALFVEQVVSYPFHVFSGYNIWLGLISLLCGAIVGLISNKPGGVFLAALCGCVIGVLTGAVLPFCFIAAVLLINPPD